jgi:hypothetical protein
MLPGSPSLRVAAARCLLASYLTPDCKQCAEAIQVLSVDWLRRQGLAPLTWHTCKSSNLPPDISQQLQQSYYSAMGDAELHRRELASVLRALNAASLSPVVFKGAALAFGIYDDPAFRTMGDLDLWITAEDIEQGRQVLEEIGYQSFRKLDRPPALMALFQGEVGLQHSYSGYGLVELHWGIFPGEWLRRAAQVSELSAIHARVVAMHLAGERAWVLSPEDAVIQSAVHTAVNHQMSMFALRALIDVTMMARSAARSATLDWTAIVQRARAWRVATAVWLVLSLAVDLARLDEAREAARQLQPSALRQRMIRRFVSAESLVEMRDLSASNWRYVFLLLLVDRGRDAVKLVFRALWPEREWLIARYGRYMFTTRLRHLFDAARGSI